MRGVVANNPFISASPLMFGAVLLVFMQFCGVSVFGQAPDMVTIVISKPKPFGSSASDEMVERLGEELVHELQGLLPAPKYRVQGEGENAAEAVTTSLTPSYRVTISYGRAESNQYEIWSDLIQGDQHSQPIASIHRLCPSGSGLLECNLNEIAAFHVRSLVKKGRPNPKRAFLELDYDAHAGGQPPGSDIALIHKFKAYFVKYGWKPVEDACYADYIFHVKATVIGDALILKATVVNANKGRMPLLSSYEPQDSLGLRDFIAPADQHAEQWVHGFVEWLREQELPN